MNPNETPYYRTTYLATCADCAWREVITPIREENSSHAIATTDAKRDLPTEILTHIRETQHDVSFHSITTRTAFPPFPSTAKPRIE